MADSRTANLRLCEAGLVRGIPSGKYLHGPSLNAEYAVRAVSVLRLRPILATSETKLWQLSCGSIDKKHNGQMDVVLNLWNKALL
jgi:hypothetical protein